MGAEATAMNTSRLAVAVGAMLAGSLAFGFDLEEKETIRKTFPAAARLELDNVNGSIHVTGYNGAEIEMVAQKTIQAETQEYMDDAKRDVKLDVKQANNTLTVFVDGPFRCNCADGDRGFRNRWHRGYTVFYDFELKAPAATILRLATVNHGEIDVKNTSADYDLNNVNGGIEMTDVSGSGYVHTVNGKISVLFARNPAGNCSFKTVNGTIETSFRPNLSADVRVKTFNGRAYTDFDVITLPKINPSAERRDGKFVYRSENFTGMRIGGGGPEFKFDTLNGSIRIIKRGQ